MPTRLRVAVALSLGASLGFLSLEVIGIPLVVIALGLIFVVSRKTGNLSVWLMSFGAGFVTSVSFFATVSSGIFSGQADPSAAEWFASNFALGVALIVLGWIVRSRRGDRDKI